VFLHPTSANRYVWAHQIFAFARDHRVIVLDHRGHGLSDKPAVGYAIGEMAKDTLSVLDHAGVGAAVLVGNSVGSMIALQIALDAPDRVLGMMLTGTSRTRSRPSESRCSSSPEKKTARCRSRRRGSSPSASPERSSRSSPTSGTSIRSNGRSPSTTTYARSSRGWAAVDSRESSRPRLQQSGDFLSCLERYDP